MKLLLVALGGAIGSVLRYAVSGFVQGKANATTAFALGTLVVNESGCFLIGVVAGLTDARGLLGPASRTFLAVGVLGGYTTFSAFGHETVASMRDGAMGMALLNVAGNVVVGLFAVMVGRMVAQVVWR